VRPPPPPGNCPPVWRRLALSLADFDLIRRLGDGSFAQARGDSVLQGAPLAPRRPPRPRPVTDPPHPRAARRSWRCGTA